MIRPASTSSKFVTWVLLVAFTAPSAFAQGAPAPSPGAPAPAAPAPSEPLPPFKKSLAETLTGMARAEYEAGRLLYLDGDYAGAALKFQRAYEESKDPRLLWNMAAAEKNLRHYAKVVELVERYVAEAGTRLRREERAESDSLLTTVRAFISTVTIDAKPEGAAIFVDDVQIGTSPMQEPVLIDMGEHRIRVSKPGYQDFTTTQSLQGGAPFSLSVQLQEVVRQGTLRVLASPGETIEIDGKVVGTGTWEGVLPSGIHQVRVTATGRRPYHSDVLIQDDQSQSLRVALEADAPPPKQKSNLTWLWIAGGGVLAAGLGVGAYFAFRPEDETTVQGTLGTVNLPALGRF